MPPSDQFKFSAALIRSILDYQKYAKCHGVTAVVLRKWASLRYRYWSIVTASDINKFAGISADLQLPHPNGIVIHRDARIDGGCMIMQQVTIGQLADGSAPLIGRGVYIGAGAKVLGGIKVGDHARIGANSVVLNDVPANATAVGAPAVIKKQGR